MTLGTSSHKTREAGCSRRGGQSAVMVPAVLRLARVSASPGGLGTQAAPPHPQPTRHPSGPLWHAALPGSHTATGWGRGSENLRPGPSWGRACGSSWAQPHRVPGPLSRLRVDPAAGRGGVGVTRDGQGSQVALLPVRKNVCGKGPAALRKSRLARDRIIKGNLPVIGFCFILVLK